MTDNSPHNTEETKRLLEIMATLRNKEIGCPWDQQQTWQSLFPFTLEEVHEVGEAIDSGNSQHVKEELGDLLFQIVFYAQIAKEQALFDFNDIAATINQKMIRRHPHVFSGKVYQSEAEQKADWQAIKQQERDEKGTKTSAGYFDDIGQHQPSLMRSVKLKKRAAQFGFDWKTWQPVAEKVREELDEVIEAIELNQGEQRLEEELGDLLMSVANLAHQLKVEPENALRKANNKFEKRVNRIREILSLGGEDTGDFDDDALESAWQQAKSEEANLL
ncbi:nucleoside triphosphate pyrophosphohydrolase [Leucothrix sargassi]|nr:nucleoside triphosphate pyrophosphohydrolase [Leucothrix sargassi]